MKDFNGGKTVIGGAYTNTHRFLGEPELTGLYTTPTLPALTLSIISVRKEMVCVNSSRSK
jgi:hypothetical protein